MARKKRCDEEAAGGAAACSCAAQQAASVSHRNIDAAQSGNAKIQVVHAQGRQNQKDGESASRYVSTLPAAPCSRSGEPVNGSAVSPTPGISPPNPNNGLTGEAGAPVGGVTEEPATQERRDFDMTGMSASRKKNLKKKMRKQEQKQQEAELHIAMQVGEGAASLADRLNQIVQRWAKRVQELETKVKGLSTAGASRELLDSVEKLQKEIQDTQENELNHAKKPLNRRASVRHVQEKIKVLELALQKQQKGMMKPVGKGAPRVEVLKSSEEWAADSSFEESLRYMAYLKEELILTQQQSDLRTFQQQALDLKTSLEELAKQAQRVAQNPGNANDARRSPQKETAWRRRLQELGSSPPIEGSGTFTAIPLSLPSEASVVLLTPQGQPSMMLRKVERKFGVVVEKKGAGDKRVNFVIVAYDPKPCNKCYAFLNECVFPQVPIGFATSPNCVSLEDHNIGAIIGSGGTNLRRLEGELDVLLWLEDKWLTVLGHADAVKKAVPHIRELRKSTAGADAGMSQATCELLSQVVRAMSQGSLGTRAHVQELEGIHGVNVVARPPRRGDTSTVTTVVVRGSSLEACKKACAELEDYFKDFHYAIVECDRTKASRVLRGSGVDFSSIKQPQKDLVSLLRCDYGVLVVAPVDALSAAVKAVAVATQQLNRASQTVEVRASDLRILTRTKRTEIENMSGATCRAPVYNGEKATLTYSGPDEAVQKAVELTQQILEEQKEEEVVVSLAAALMLLMDKAQLARALEEEHDLRIKVDVPRERVVVRGGSVGCGALAEAIKEVETDVAASGKVAQKIDVPRESVSLIIGRQGTNVRRLQQECNLDNVVVEGRPQTVLYMLGTQSAVDQGAVMVRDLLSNGQGSMRTNWGDVEAERRPRPSGSHRGARGDGSGRVGGLSVRGRGGRVAVTTKPYNASADDESAFPSLGMCTARPGGRWQKKSPSANDAVAPVSKVCADDEADAECHEAADGAN